MSPLCRLCLTVIGVDQSSRLLQQSDNIFRVALFADKKKNNTVRTPPIWMGSTIKYGIFL